MARALGAGALLAAAPAAALDWSAAAEGWNHGADGYVDDQGDRLDFDDDLAVRTVPRARYSLELAGAAGAWPDWAASATHFGGRGRRVVEGVTVFGPIELAPGATLRSRAVFADQDLAVRWPWRCGAWRCAAGVALKHLDGEVVISDDEGQNTRQPYDEWFPQLHLDLRRRFTAGVMLAARAQGAAWDGALAGEWQVGAELGWFRPLYVRAAWMEKRYRIEAGGDRLDARLAGPLLGLGFRLR